MTHISFVYRSNFRCLYPIRPLSRSPGGLRKPPDVLFQPFILKKLRFLSALEILKPGREISASHFNVCPVQSQDMIHASIQKMPVMGNQNKPFLSFQIGCRPFSGLRIQMICRFINQKKISLFQEQGS